ncbi:MAG TPA: DUF3592 domain-containing protein [Clostridia bacterium]|nr:DUF3592 domain-containing protein [Clostridia bacterium]
MSFVGLFVIIFSGTFGILGLTFLVVGLVFNATTNGKRNRCTSETEGVVTAFQTQFGSSGVRLVYSFSIDGQPMQYLSPYAMNTPNLLVGQKVTVHYDPQNIGNVFIEEERGARTFSRIFVILGAVFVFVALFSAAILLGIAKLP